MLNGIFMDLTRNILSMGFTSSDDMGIYMYKFLRSFLYTQCGQAFVLKST